MITAAQRCVRSDTVMAFDILPEGLWFETADLHLGDSFFLCDSRGTVIYQATELEQSRAESSIRKTISSACVVTWFNPQAIIDGTMMLGAFHATLSGPEGITFITGVASASCLWFTGVTLLISIFSNRFDAKILRIINVVCGAVIIFYGCKLLWSFVNMVM